MVLSTKPAQQTNTQTLSFEDVPNEIVSLIFENHASVREMSVMSQVSKRYYLLFQEK
ncbi:MAG: hypothetical protein HWD59_00340 [Coxiellaceae bacterium]|nr:MAG: hypothetical protein HWD59_00340 [Coxiellaceae bacterium]